MPIGIAFFSCKKIMLNINLLYDACIEKIKKSGLKYEIGAMSTTFEGEFDEVFDLLKTVHKIPFQLGCERVITVARIDEKAGGLTIENKLRNHR